MAVVTFINCDWPAIKPVTCDVVGEGRDGPAGRPDGGHVVTE